MIIPAMAFEALTAAAIGAKARAAKAGSSTQTVGSGNRTIRLDECRVGTATRIKNPLVSRSGWNGRRKVRELKSQM